MNVYLLPPCHCFPSALSTCFSSPHASLLSESVSFTWPARREVKEKVSHPTIDPYVCSYIYHKNELMILKDRYKFNYASGYTAGRNDDKSEKKGEDLIPNIAHKKKKVRKKVMSL